PDIVAVEHGNRIGERIAVTQGVNGCALVLQDGVDDQSQVLLAGTNRPRTAPASSFLLGASGLSAGAGSVHPKRASGKAEKRPALGRPRLWRKVRGAEGTRRGGHAPRYWSAAVRFRPMGATPAGRREGRDAIAPGEAADFEQHGQ